MKHLFVELNDLPDEILLNILKKLDNVEVLNSLIGINKRFNRIVHDPIFTSYLSLMKYSSNNSVHYALPDSILDQCCLQILPSIHHKINWLDLELTSIERILLATNYSNLNRLGLYNIDIDKAISIFTDEFCLIAKFKNQISSLLINFDGTVNQTATKDTHTLIFTQILTKFTNLKSLNFDQSSVSFRRLSFSLSPPTIISSTLLELYVSTRNFNDCLYLLDGHFPQLHTLDIGIYHITTTNLTIHDKDKLPNLRCFSLHCDIDVDDYDKLIIPLLHRMLNLEKLDLLLRVYREKGLIDMNELKMNIINYMSQLNKFILNIFSHNTLPIQNSSPLNENNDNIIKYLYNNQIISCIDYFPEKQYNQCLIYSYPYTLEFYNNISNKFPGGLFKYVREVSLYDEYPFAHEFFIRIQKSFPLMKKLTIINEKAQINKQCIQSNYDNQYLSIIEYLHLTTLILNKVHDDYIELFLDHTKMCLSNNLFLYVTYRSLERVTHHFQREATQINCTKLRCLSINGISSIPDHVKNYFPNTKMYSLK
ncbi:unnamed protein product [Adineta steineri]|uniref:F-box domain-containing protein n=1 Tax=Adineta steineri TaxID=433720 RepID=A0A814S6Q8_9BILA|nr:unnamed protein product [Adineta steineri]CAF1142249.1 unnamed protein product [Adineta steineri]